jgi:hypothetical protein
MVDRSMKCQLYQFQKCDSKYKQTMARTKHNCVVGTCIAERNFLLSEVLK